MTIKIPSDDDLGVAHDDDGPDGFPFAIVTDGDDNPRDVSKPLGKDEHGRLLYAPHGITVRL